MPFDISITGRNEMGQGTSLAIYGVEFLNHGQGISTEDITIEDQFTSKMGATEFARTRENRMNCWEPLRAPLPQRSSKEQMQWFEKCGDWAISSQVTKVQNYVKGSEIRNIALRNIMKCNKNQIIMKTSFAIFYKCAASISMDGDIIRSLSKDEEISVVASNYSDWKPAVGPEGQANDIGGTFQTHTPGTGTGV